ncbi:ArsR family transcriptional regulator [Haloferula luteola]|uniref:ArsR family transcriptional regulator n=1 Tax=Haloferula luteola TaxID=595692 RepID=A0A840UXJ6_9BACT|nr:metalloregulator ArsR/SmtB family transcription factor [Haloferula luteola]MBB5350492.1 ArsR family transcriptional regulator [Haloferula luteola]
MKALESDRLVQVIKALAHPTRLEIVQLLASGTQSVGALQAHVGGDLSTVSKHLTLMRKAGWIRCEKQGQQVIYQLACECLPTFLHCIQDIAASDSSCGCESESESCSL